MLKSSGGIFKEIRLFGCGKRIYGTMDSLIKDRIKEFCQRAGIELLVLFGSSAKGVDREGSDVDLAVKMNKNRTASKLDLLYELGAFFPDREIDLVILSVNTDPVLLFEIFSNGKALYEDYPGIFVNQYVRACKLYYDTEKLRRMNADYLKKFVEKSRNVA